MPYSARPIVLATYYLLNFGLVVALLGAAFFLSQGLFGAFYSCNESTLGEVERVYNIQEWQEWQFCLVDLNYTTAMGPNDEEQSFYAFQITLPCNRLLKQGTDENLTTPICYNRYHPEFFSSITEADALQKSYSKNDAVRDMELGFKAVLWMALFAFLASSTYKNLDALDQGIIQLHQNTVEALKFARQEIFCYQHLRVFVQSSGEGAKDRNSILRLGFFVPSILSSVVKTIQCCRVRAERLRCQWRRRQDSQGTDPERAGEVAMVETAQ